MTIKSAVCFIICALLSASILGCSVTRHAPLDPRVVSTLRDKEVVVVRRPVRDFGANIRNTLPWALAVPMFSILAMQQIAIRSGNSLVKENDIKDPAYQIAEDIAASMGIHYGTKYMGISNIEIGDDDDVLIVATIYQPVSLVLDVKTIGWGLSYRIITSDQYHVSFRMRLRLVNTETRNVLVEGYCSYRTPDDETATFDELVANSAIRLKEELKKGARFCAHEFSSKYLLM